MILSGIYLVIKYIFGLLQVVLSLRLVLKFLGAQETAVIVDGIYSFTGFLIAPFEGIFENIPLQFGGIIDIVTISSMLGYLLVFFIILKLLNTLKLTREINRKKLW